MSLKKHKDGIYVYRPVTLVSFGVGYRLSFIAGIDRMVMRIQLRRALKKLGLRSDKVVSFIFKTHQYYLADLIPGALRCYEVTDEYLVYPHETDIDFDSSHTIRALKAENKILAASDIVLASSPALSESRRRRFANTHYVANSADYGHFSSAMKENVKIPEDLAAISPPRAGYVGNINELLQTDLLMQLALDLPHVSLILIGKENGSIRFKSSPLYRKIKSLPNVHFMGYRPYAQLPQYLKGLSMCMMPFRMNEWMRNSFPNKIFQYLAAGKPVVSTDFPAVREFRDCIYVADSISEFITLIERGIHEDNEHLVKARQAVAIRNSTDDRAEQILDIIESFISVYKLR